MKSTATLQSGGTRLTMKTSRLQAQPVKLAIRYTYSLEDQTTGRISSRQSQRRAASGKCDHFSGRRGYRRLRHRIFVRCVKGGCRIAVSASGPEIWYLGPMNGPKIPRFWTETRVLDNSQVHQYCPFDEKGRCRSPGQRRVDAFYLTPKLCDCKT